MSKTSKSKVSNKSTSSSNFDSKTTAVIGHKGYRVENKLGQGAFGIVFKAVNKEGQLSAVKVIDLEKMSDRSKAKFLPREIQTLIDCRHENLIAVYDIFRANNKMFIFMEFAGNGDISGYAKKHHGIKEELAAKWFFQASSGLGFLHESLRTTHRDIKLDNHFVAKVTDFGFAKQSWDAKLNCVILSGTFCGTLPYECPEILEHKKYDAFKADTWSMGVTLFIMLHDRFPFHYRDRKLMLSEIKNHPKFIRSRYTKKLPSGANSLIEHLLDPSEEKRATVQVILANNYLRNYAK